MTRVIRPAILCVVLACLNVLTPASGQPLPSDPSLVRGELDNGLRYVVKRHAVPPGRAVVWVHIHSGSLNETDKQRGLAHYLEHMAFNGSAHFAPGSLVPFFQSLGMTFGRDQNAFTNMTQTTYQLSLPDATPDTLGKGMTFFADVVSGLSLLPKEVDAERQIIQEERRRSLSGRQRTGFYVMERMTPGSIYGQRITIGTEETINGVQEQDFRDYYGKWYAASNATLMVVADADPAEVIKVIQDKFGKASKKPRPTPQELGVKAYSQSFAIVASDPEVRGEDIRITRLEPAHPPVTTVPQYRDQLVLRLGEMAMNRRLSDKAAIGGTSYANARVSAGNESNAIHTAGISGRANPGKWRETLDEIALELQRARAFGFATDELDEARKQIMTGAERAVETESTAPAQGIIGRLNSDVTSGEPTMSPTQRLDLLKTLLPGITPEEVTKRFAAEFDPKAVAFIAVMPAGPGVPSESQLLEMGTKALAVTPTADTHTAHAVASLLAGAPTPGTVKESAEHAATGVWSGWLSNNVRLHHRFMDQRKNEVSVQIALIGGELLETAENRGITRAAELAWGRAATKHLTSSEVRDYMAGRKVSVRGGGGFGGGGRGGRGGGGGGGGGGDAVTLSISGNPDELETGFQLAYLLLTEPLIEPANFTQFQAMSRQNLQESMRSPQAMGARLVASAPYPDDEIRTRPMTVEQNDKLTRDAAQAWLEKIIKDSPIEVTIVGDVSRERAIDLACKYLGALPARPRVAPEAYMALRTLKRPAGPRIIERTVDSPTAQAYVYSGFYGADESNRADARALTLAARILSTRMVKEVREEAQLVYSMSAGSRAASTYPGFGVFSAGATTDPPKTKALVEKLASMYAAFAKSGPTEEEMEVAKKQMANTFRDQLIDPGYWSGRLGRMTYHGVTPDDIAADPAAYQALTAAQVRETFAKYYAADKAIVVVVKPSGSGGGAGAAAEGEGNGAGSSSK